MGSFCAWIQEKDVSKLMTLCAHCQMDDQRIVFTIASQRSSHYWKELYFCKSCRRCTFSQVRSCSSSESGVEAPVLKALSFNEARNEIRNMGQGLQYIQYLNRLDSREVLIAIGAIIGAILLGRVVNLLV